MARSFSSAKFVTALISNTIARRGNSTAATESVAKVAAAAASRSVSKNPAEKSQASSSEKVAWVPDPVTGYYRPEGVAEEIDVAELRAMLLKKN